MSVPADGASTPIRRIRSWALGRAWAASVLVLPAACSPGSGDAPSGRADEAPGRQESTELDRREAAASHPQEAAEPDRRDIVALVHDHARAWETGDTASMSRILHEDARLAYPRRRLGKREWIEDLAEFSSRHVDTRVYVHAVVVDGSDFAVEWQFATTDRETGIRTAVGDAIIGAVRDGRIVEWKEYLDGRVPELQRQGRLPLDEGLEPFPWPSTR